MAFIITIFKLSVIILLLTLLAETAFLPRGNPEFRRTQSLEHCCWRS